MWRLWWYLQQTQQQAHVHTTTEMTQSDEDGDKLFFLGRTGGLKCLTGKSKTLVLLSSHCLSVSLRIPVGQACCWMSERSRRKKVTLFQHMSGRQVQECVCLCMRCSVCVFCIGTAVWFLTVMMWGLHKLTNGEGENENKNGRQGKRKMRATEPERQKLSHSEVTVDIADWSSVDYTFPSVDSTFFIRLPFLFPSFLSGVVSSSPLSPPITVFQSRVRGWRRLTQQVSKVHPRWGNGVSYL